VTTVEWECFQACTQVCGAASGKPCLQLSGFVVGSGVVAVEADAPHTGRERRAGR